MFANGVVLTGSIDGKGGSDTLDFSAYGTAVNVLLTALGGTDGFNGTTSGATNPITAGFSNIDVIDGAASGSLTGINTAATWDLSLGTYTSTHVLTFTGFNTLIAGNGTGDTFDINANVAYTLDGGTGADKFVFSNGKVLTGSIDGKGGNDTLDFTGYATAVSVSLSAIGVTPRRVQRQHLGCHQPHHRHLQQHQRDPWHGERQPHGHEHRRHLGPGCRAPIPWGPMC